MLASGKELLLNGQLLKHLGITLAETFASFFLVTAVSLFTAILLWWNNTLSEILEPYFVILNSLPKSAMAPIFIVWLGNNMKTIIVTAISVAIFGNIVTIMTRTVSGMDGPIKEIVSGFLVTAERYGNADLAFDFACESVDNRTLKTIFVNLKNCMHYQANYEEVLTQMMGQITESMSAREERKNILFSMKLTLIAISVMSVIIVVLIGKGIGVDVKGILTKNLAGHCFLIITSLM